MNNLLNFNNRNNGQSIGEQITNTVKGFLKSKLLLPLAGGGGFLLFLILIITIVIMPLVAIDDAMNGVKKTLDDAGKATGSFFESLGNFFTTGYWGSSEEVFYKVVGDRYDYYIQKGINVDAPLVLSAVFVGNTMMNNTNSECTIESKEVDEGEMPDINLDCGDDETEQSYGELRKEAIYLMDGMVNGSSVKSEEEYRKWLHDNYIEDKLKRMGVDIPKDEKEREKLFEDTIDQIYFNREMYEAALNGFTDEEATGNVCKFSVNSSAGLQTISNVKVRLLGCTASGGSSGPLEDEELVDLEKYILGVTYTENGGAPDEAIKMQAIAARSFLLTRSYGGKIEQENGSSIVQIRACTWDQAYCDPDKGCWSNGAGGEYGNTIHTGYDPSKKWSKKPLPENDRIRTLVAETAGQVVVDKDGKVLNTPYMSDVQQQWNTMANQGKTVAEMVKKTYPNAVEITSNCTGGGDGSIEGNPNFENAAAWKAPSNPYAPNYYGQCTWFAWGRFYEIYGYSPGFTGYGYQCAEQTYNAHPDKFTDPRNTKFPVAGAVGSSDYAHNHVFIVTGVEGNKITIQEGNLSQEHGDNYKHYVPDSWGYAIKDWQTVTYTIDQLRGLYGDVRFANPINPPK